MPQSLSVVYVHLVFSMKDRRPFFRDPTLRTQLHAYLAETSNQIDCPALMVGGVEDHVHMLARQGRTITQANWVKEIKRVSNVWLKTRGPDFSDFSWQGGYGLFSVSASKTDEVFEYIEKQEEHHRKFNFQEEMRVLLAKHGIQWDERYLWD